MIVQRIRFWWGLLAGILLCCGIGTPARAQGLFSPKPVPGGIQPLGPGTEIFHHFPPTPGSEPSQISDFHGLVGNTRLFGTGTGTNTVTGATSRLLFQADMGFMKGWYISVGGLPSFGTFAFIWLDLFEGQFDLPSQIHDYNPGVSTTGLFWTIPVSSDSVQVDLNTGTASLSVTDLAIEDSHDVVNALMRGPTTPAMVSFDIRWGNPIRLDRVRDEVVGFDLLFFETLATAEWSAKQADFEFVSDPASTSINGFSVIGVERNGLFMGEKSPFFFSLP